MLINPFEKYCKLAWKHMKDLCLLQSVLHLRRLLGITELCLQTSSFDWSQDVNNVIIIKCNKPYEAMQCRLKRFRKWKRPNFQEKVEWFNSTASVILFCPCHCFLSEYIPLPIPPNLFKETIEHHPITQIKWSFIWSRLHILANMHNRNTRTGKIVHWRPFS